MTTKNDVLVIVESPSKASTIEKYLGKGYKVLSSKGHIRDLSKKKMGVDPANNWATHYEIDPQKAKDVEILRTAAKKASSVYLATDRDREGEAIAWHLKELLTDIKGTQIKGVDFKRVVFNEVTKKAISQSFEHPGEIDQDLVNAQQARRILDRIIGFELSPVLWVKVARNLSAGRVQSVALRLLVEREREIKDFKPTEYWTLTAKSGVEGYPLQDFNVSRYLDAPLKIGNEEEANQHLERLESALAEQRLERCEFATQMQSPKPPLITTTLQREASTRLGMSVYASMQTAQRLYEAGHITYMRTDSFSISTDAVTALRSFIDKKYGGDFLPKTARVFKNKSQAQESHEAIRPTAIGDLETTLRGIPARDKSLYELIWRHFVASQMTPHKIGKLTVKIGAGDYRLAASGRTSLFPGYTVVLPHAAGENKELPGFSEIAQKNQIESLAGVKLHSGGAEGEQQFTSPPRRQSEATLVRELEKRGIGRPSTYSSIIGTLVQRGYVETKSRTFYVTPLGEIVCDRLVESFDHLMNYEFTAEMEADLDRIAAGKHDWKSLLDEFYWPFHDKVVLAGKGEEEGGMKRKTLTSVDLPCPECGKTMVLRLGRQGLFLSCSNSGRAEGSCQGARSIEFLSEEDLQEEANSEDNQVAKSADKGQEDAQMEGRSCPVCKSKCNTMHINQEYRFYLCSRYPRCEGNIAERGNYAGVAQAEIECERCQGVMLLKKGRFGYYFDCNDCDNTRKATTEGKPLPPRMQPIDLPDLICEKNSESHYVLREGASGLFLAANNYPKVRESRSIKVSELSAVTKGLPEKFEYLTKAPVQDDDGNPTVVRFSRKMGEHFVGSLREGKATSWISVYDPATQGWRVSEAKPKSSGRKPAAKRRAKNPTKKLAKRVIGRRSAKV